ncbi:hypothetical protein GY45DRAFT_512522 [Cubamyces sp. BRFM 1775]|nr:hypothetical protein GY45DRAFT_512522 [Cubamyces sp. BRFM 1775]
MHNSRTPYDPLPHRRSRLCARPSIYTPIASLELPSPVVRQTRSFVRPQHPSLRIPSLAPRSKTAEPGCIQRFLSLRVERPGPYHSNTLPSPQATLYGREVARPSRFRASKWEKIRALSGPRGSRSRAAQRQLQRRTGSSWNSKPAADDRSSSSKT